MQDALAHAFKRPVGAAQMIEFNRERVLGVDVFATAPLEEQPDFDIVAFPLVEVDYGSARPEIVAAVLTRDRVHGVRAQLAAPGRLGDRVTNLRAHPHLIDAHRGMHLEGGPSGVLADGALARGRLIDIFGNHRQRLGAPCAFRLLAHRVAHGLTYIGRQVRGCPRDQLHHALKELRRHSLSINLPLERYRIDACWPGFAVE